MAATKTENQDYDDDDDEDEPCVETLTARECVEGIGELSDDCNGGTIINSLIFGTGICSNTTCSSTCGDGMIELFENCDDNNTMNGDGCSSRCKIETFAPDPLPGCGFGCLEETRIGAQVPILDTNTVQYTFERNDSSCDTETFVLFDIPACAEVMAVTGDCVVAWDVPCLNSGDALCTSVGTCSGVFTPQIGRPLRVDINGSCVATVAFTRNMTYGVDSIGIDGGNVCPTCQTVVPVDCFTPGQNSVIPNFVCARTCGASCCIATFTYTVNGSGVIALPTGPLNNIFPTAVSTVDHTPYLFIPGDTGEYSVMWDCYLYPTLTWTLDGSTAVAAFPYTPTCPDCNNNTFADAFDIDTGFSKDCNENNIPDECDIANGTSTDDNINGVPDECEQTPIGDDGLHPAWPGYVIGGTAMVCCCCWFFLLPFRRRRRRRHEDDRDWWCLTSRTPAEHINYDNDDEETSLRSRPDSARNFLSLDADKAHMS